MKLAGERTSGVVSVHRLQRVAAMAMWAVAVALPAACGDDDPLDDCPDGQIAFFEIDGNCGRSGEEPDCAESDCSASGDLPLACGCDGVVYDNFCDATQANVDLDDEGQCDIAAERFRCGPLQCTRVTTYCEERLDTGERSEYACPNVPVDCDPPACDCLDASGIGEVSCSASDGELFVVIGD